MPDDIENIENEISTAETQDVGNESAEDILDVNAIENKENILLDDLDILDDVLDSEKSLYIKRKKLIKRTLKIVGAVIILAIIGRIIYLMTIPEFTIINSYSNKDNLNSGKPVINYVNKSPNTLYVYTQLNGSAYNQNMFISYADEDTMQFSVLLPFVSNSWFNEIYEIVDGEVRLIYAYPYTMTYQQRNLNLLAKDFGEEYAVVLKEPIVAGNSWQITEGTGEAKIMSVDKQVKTPYGTFKCIEVSSDYFNGTYRKDYYSETVGLVKSIYVDAEGDTYEVYLSNKIPLSEGLTHALYVYYLEKGTLNSKPTLVDFKLRTNEPIEAKLQEILSTTNDENIRPLISPSTKINSINVSMDNSYVTVDFSKEFLEYTSKDKGKESKHLTAIANTFARYYQVLKCKITIDGEPYTSKNYNFTESDSIRATFR